MNDRKGLIIAFVALLVAIPSGIAGMVYLLDFASGKWNKNPRLVAAPPVQPSFAERPIFPLPPVLPGDPPIEQNYVPYENGQPTPVFIENKGEDEALIQRVAFAIQDRWNTTNREQLYGAGKTIPVVFNRKHYDRARNRFVLAFSTLQTIPGKNQHSSLSVAIVDPAWVGNTYLGTLTVYFKDGPPYNVPRVELDVLKSLPR
jgi:hypothetical protein